jgi:hypothetical protein
VLSEKTIGRGIGILAGVVALSKSADGKGLSGGEEANKVGKLDTHVEQEDVGGNK